MQRYALLYEGLKGSTSFKEAENIVIGRLKLSKDRSERFFAGKPVLNNTEDKIEILQKFLEKSGIKVTKQQLPIDPSQIELSHVYEKLLLLEEKITAIALKIEPQTTTNSNERMEAISGHFKEGLDKANFLANNLKETGQAKLELLKQDHKIHPSISTDSARKSSHERFNWIALLGGAHYYSGYGHFKKGLILAVTAGILPFLTILIALYAGFKASDELPIKKEPFQWRKFTISLTTQLIVTLFVGVLLTVSERSSLPSPSLATTVNRQQAELFNEELANRLRIEGTISEGEKSEEGFREIISPILIQVQNNQNVSLGGSLALLASYACLDSLPPNSEVHAGITMIAIQAFDSDYEKMNNFNIIDNDSLDLITSLTIHEGQCSDSQKEIASQYLKQLL